MQSSQPGDAAIWTVSALNFEVKTLLSRGLGTLWIEGEISNFARPASGHWYFTLKDDGGEVRCVMWRSSAASVKFDAQDGMEVVVSGYVDVYEPRGQYQLYVRKIEPRGVGALELAFRQLKEKLEKLGI